MKRIDEHYVIRSISSKAKNATTKGSPYLLEADRATTSANLILCKRFMVFTSVYHSLLDLSLGGDTATNSFQFQFHDQNRNSRLRKKLSLSKMSNHFVRNTGIFRPGPFFENNFSWQLKCWMAFVGMSNGLTRINLLKNNESLMSTGWFETGKHWKPVTATLQKAKYFSASWGFKSSASHPKRHFLALLELEVH